MLRKEKFNRVISFLPPKTVFQTYNITFICSGYALLLMHLIYVYSFIFSCSKFKADRCFARAEKGCAYAAGVRDLFINQALPEVCKGDQYVHYRKTVIPSSCPASQY